VAQAAAIAALDDAEFVQRSREANRTGLKQLADGFRAFGSHVRAVRRQFHLVQVPDGAKAFAFMQARARSSGRLEICPTHVRITVGTAAQNERCLTNLRRIWPQAPKPKQWN